MEGSNEDKDKSESFEAKNSHNIPEKSSNSSKSFGSSGFNLQSGPGLSSNNFPISFMNTAIKSSEPKENGKETDGWKLRDLVVLSGDEVLKEPEDGISDEKEDSEDSNSSKDHMDSSQVESSEEVSEKDLLLRQNIQLVQMMKQKNEKIKLLQSQLDKLLEVEKQKNSDDTHMKEEEEDIIRETEKRSLTVGDNIRLEAALNELKLVKNDQSFLNSQILKSTNQLSNRNIQIRQLENENSLLNAHLKEYMESKDASEKQLSTERDLHKKAAKRLEEIQQERDITIEKLHDELHLHKSASNKLKNENSNLMSKLESLNKELLDLEANFADRRRQWNSKLESLEDKVRESLDEAAEWENRWRSSKRKLDKAAEILKGVGLSVDGDVLDEIIPLESQKKDTPSKLSADKLLEKPRSFTELYTQLHSTQLALRQAQKQNKSLKSNLSSILGDISDKSQYFSQLESHYALVQDQLERSKLECMSFKHEKAKLHEDNLSLVKKVEETQSECKWLKQSCEDLSSQLRACLARQMELSGEIPPPQDQNMIGSNDAENINEESVVQSLISKRMVKISNIEEMQKKNSELLMLVRKLSQEIENLESSYMGDQSNSENRDPSQKQDLTKRFDEVQSELISLKKKYSDAVREVSSLKGENVKMDAILKSIEDERDMYRRVAGDVADVSPWKKPSREIISTGVDESSYEELQKSYTHYKTKWEELSRQFEDYRVESSKNYELVSEKLEASNNNLSLTKIKKAQLETQIEFLESRVKDSQENFDRIRSESEKLRERQASLINQISRLEESLETSDKEKVSALSEAENLKNRISFLDSTIEYLKKNEDRYYSDREYLIRERDQLTDMLKRVKNVQTDLSTASSEKVESLEALRKRLEADLQETKSELKDLKTSHSLEMSKKESLITELKAQVEELKTQFSNAQEEARNERLKNEEYRNQSSKWEEMCRVKEELASGLRVRINMLESFIKEIESKIVKDSKSSENDTEGQQRASSLTSSLSPTTIDDIRSFMASSQEKTVSGSEFQKLKSDLETATEELAIYRDHAEKYRLLSEESEAKLRENHDAFKQYQAKIDSEIKQYEDRQAGSDQKLNEYESRIRELETKLGEAEKAFETEKLSLQKELSQTMIKYEEVANSEKLARGNLESLKKDLDNQRKMLDDQNSNFEKELQKHSEAVGSVDSLEARLKEIEMEKQRLEFEVNATEIKLKDAQESWNIQKQLLEKQNEDMVASIKGYQVQNGKLHEQLDIVLAQLKELKAPLKQDEIAALVGEDYSSLEEDKDDAAGKSADKIVDDLRSMVSFLNKEKEVMKYDIETQEKRARRLETQLENNTKLLEQSREELNQERQRIRGSHVLSPEEYNTLKQSEGQIQLLKQNNLSLKSEYDHECQMRKEREQEIQGLQMKLSPLLEEVGQLKAQIESQQENIERLNKENKEWQSRNQALIGKYEQIDPAKYLQLLSENTTLKRKLAESSKMEEKAKLLEDSAQDWEKKAKEFEISLKNTNITCETLKLSIKSLEDEKSRLKAELDGLTGEIKESKVDLSKQKSAITTPSDLVAESEKSPQKNLLFEEKLGTKSKTDTMLPQKQTGVPVFKTSIFRKDIPVKQVVHSEQAIFQGKRSLEEDSFGSVKLEFVSSEERITKKQKTEIPPDETGPQVKEVFGDTSLKVESPSTIEEPTSEIPGTDSREPVITEVDDTTKDSTQRVSDVEEQYEVIEDDESEEDVVDDDDSYEPSENTPEGSVYEPDNQSLESFGESADEPEIVDEIVAEVKELKEDESDISPKSKSLKVEGPKKADDKDHLPEDHKQESVSESEIPEDSVHGSVFDETLSPIKPFSSPHEEGEIEELLDVPAFSAQKDTNESLVQDTNGVGMEVDRTTQPEEAGKETDKEDDSIIRTRSGGVIKKIQFDGPPTSSQKPSHIRNIGRGGSRGGSAIRGGSRGKPGKKGRQSKGF